MQTPTKIQNPGPALGANITTDYYMGERDSNGRKSGYGELFYTNNQTAYKGVSFDTFLLRKLFNLHFEQIFLQSLKKNINYFLLFVPFLLDNSEFLTESAVDNLDASLPY